MYVSCECCVFSGRVVATGRTLVKGSLNKYVCVCVCVSLSVITCYNNPLRLKWADRDYRKKSLQILSIEGLNATVTATRAAQADLSLCTFLSLALEASEWSASLFTPTETVAGTQWIGGCMGPTAGLVTLKKGFLALLRAETRNSVYLTRATCTIQNMLART